MNNRESGADGVHIWLVLWKAFRAMEKYAGRSIETSGMCQSDFAVLEALLHKGPSTVSVLGGKVMLTSGSITTAVDRMEKRGLVERGDVSADRRARIVNLTGAGKKLIRRLFAQHQQAMEQAVAALDARQKAQLIQLLKTLGRTVEQE